MGNLFKSRKFVTLLWDAGISTLAFVLGFWLAPERLDQVLVLIGAWQPIFISMIIGVAVEDAAAYRAGAHVSQQDQPKKPMSEDGRA